MKKQLFIATLLAYSMTSGAQTEITTYTPGVSAEGAVYYLPKTAINVNIDIEKTVYTPGDLSQYAERFLRINNVAQQESQRYAIKGVSLVTVGVPDVSKAYNIKLTTKSVAPLIELSEAGILLSVNTSSSCDTEEKKPTNVSKAAKKETPNSRTFMTEEMLLTASKAKLAELVAQEIYNIRENRNLILRGQNENIPKDGEGIQIILDGLQQQEEALMQLFVGTTTTTVTTKSFQVIPEGNIDRYILGRFSHKLGLLHQDDLAGAPIYINISSNNYVPAPAPEPENKKKTILKEKKKKQDGIVYNVPDKVDVKVYTNTTTLAEENLSIAQFGNTETLSSSLFSKRKDIKVWFDPATGALCKIEE